MANSQDSESVEAAGHATVNLPTPQPWYVRVLRVAQTLSVALLPALGLMIYLRHKPRADVPEYVIQGVTLWAVLHLLAAFDPYWSAKVAAFKEVTQSFPLLGRNKKG